ncbi:MAG: bifunctional serine/threonine-protein kinase/formylglycine-generating enzyme family protein, partial [Planctomycetota bacterium]
MEDPFIGRTLGSHEILEKVGEGGMGAVYRATHTNLEREDAIKILPDRLVKDHPQVVERFLVEARAAAKVNNPHIVQVHDAGVVDGVHFITMEFVRGLSLKGLQAKKSPIPLREAVKIIVQASKGLKAAAKEKVIHRDIKPANIMLADAGIVKVADFGLAKNLDADLGITHSGQSLGTPAYMSPEQGEGEAADFRSDIYSLGCTFFEMITGQRPYSAQSAVGVLMKHVQEPIPDPLAINPGLPPSVRPVIDKMMAKAADDRYQSYDELIKEMMSIKDNLGKGGMPSGDETPVTIRPDSDQTPVTMHAGAARGAKAGETPSSGEGGHSRSMAPILAGGGVALVLLIVGLLAVLGVFGGGDEGKKRTEETEASKKDDDERREKKKKIKEILGKAGDLEKQERHQDALALLSEVAKLDPDNEGAAKIRDRLEKALDELREASESESIYNQYWTSADLKRAEAEVSNKAGDWALVVKYVEKALAVKKTNEAESLLAHGRAMQDWALAREAEARGELEEALRLAERARSRDKAPALSTYCGQLKTRIAERKAAKDKEKRFADLVDKAEAAAAEGAAPEALMETWREAQGAAQTEEGKQRCLEELAKLQARLDFAEAMAQAEGAEEEGRFSDALKHLERAAKTGQSDSRLDEALKRVKAKFEEIHKERTEKQKEEERVRLLASLMNDAEKAEKTKVKGRTGELFKALTLWRKARELAREEGDVKKIEGRIKSLIKPVFRRAMMEGRAAETRKDWISAERAYEEAEQAKPDDRNLKRATARVHEKMVEVLKLIGSAMMIPEEEKDARSNPVETRNGSLSDPDSGLPYEIWLKNPRIELVLAPVGKFKIGSPRTEPGHGDDERPQINIHMGEPFYMGKYEVTQKQWKAVMEKIDPRFEGNDLPAECITWRDAKKFCDELNDKMDGGEDTPPYFS